MSELACLLTTSGLWYTLITIYSLPASVAPFNRKISNFNDLGRPHT